MPKNHNYTLEEIDGSLAEHGIKPHQQRHLLKLALEGMRLNRKSYYNTKL